MISAQSALPFCWRTVNRLWREILQIYTNRTNLFFEYLKDLYDFCAKRTPVLLENCKSPTARNPSNLYKSNKSIFEYLKDLYDFCAKRTPVLLENCKSPAVRNPSNLYKSNKSIFEYLKDLYDLPTAIFNSAQSALPFCWEL